MIPYQWFHEHLTLAMLSFLCFTDILPWYKKHSMFSSFNRSSTIFKNLLSHGQSCNHLRGTDALDKRREDKALVGLRDFFEKRNECFQFCRWPCILVVFRQVSVFFTSSVHVGLQFGSLQQLNFLKEPKIRVHEHRDRL